MELFQKLDNNQKIDFFVACQTLLIAHHPKSEFLFTETNLKERKHYVYNFFHKYNGYYYRNDNICILYNTIKVEDELNPIKAVKDHIYRPPTENFNAYSIDFVVFRKLTDCLGFCRAQYVPQIKYIVFVKNHEVKLYKTDKLLEKLASVPLVAFV